MGQRPLQPGVTAVTDIAVAEARLPKRVQLGAGGKFSAVPGLALTASVAGLAFAVRGIPGVGILSPMILATLLGMIFHNVVGTPLWAKPGVIFSLRRILRLGIILLGLQLMASQVAEVGFVGVGVILASLAGTFVFTKWLGRVLGVGRAGERQQARVVGLLAVLLPARLGIEHGAILRPHGARGRVM